MDKNLSLEDYKSLSPEGQRMHDVGQAVKWARGQTDETYGGACVLVMADEIVRLTAELAAVTREREAAMDTISRIDYQLEKHQYCAAMGNRQYAHGIRDARKIIAQMLPCAENAPISAESEGKHV